MRVLELEYCPPNWSAALLPLLRCRTTCWTLAWAWGTANATALATLSAAFGFSSIRAATTLSARSGAAKAAAEAMASIWSGAAFAAAAATAGAVDGAALITELTTVTAAAGFLAIAARTTTTAVASFSFFEALVTASVAFNASSAPGASLMDLVMSAVSFLVNACAGEPAKHMRLASTAATTNRLLFFILGIAVDFPPQTALTIKLRWRYSQTNNLGTFARANGARIPAFPCV